MCENEHNHGCRDCKHCLSIIELDDGRFTVKCDDEIEAMTFTEDELNVPCGIWEE